MRPCVPSMLLRACVYAYLRNLDLRDDRRCDALPVRQVKIGQQHMPIALKQDVLRLQVPTHVHAMHPGARDDVKRAKKVAKRPPPEPAFLERTSGTLQVWAGRLPDYKAHV
eukprot:306653-Chlamydomonas_euryale.AAC.2